MSGDAIESNRVKLRLDRLVAGGEAMGRLDDGRVAFVRGGLAGEEVDARVLNDRKDFVRAHVDSVDDVLEASVERVVPTCPHRRAGCGGCGWMHLSTAAQFDAKVDIVKESLRRIGRLDDGVVDAVVRAGGSVEPFGYRTTLRLTGIAASDGGGVGFREERSDEVVAIDHCQVAHENISRLLRDLEVAPGVELTLRTSVATGGVTARWTKPEDRRRRGERRRKIAADAGGRGAVSGLPSDVHIGDRAFLTERIAGANLMVSAPSFFQSGAQAAELLVDAVERTAPELGRAKHALDAYGGVGLFAATVMRPARHVTLVESSRSSTLDAAVNLETRSASIVRTDVAKWVLPDGSPPIDVIVADPARPGLAKPGVGALVATSAPVLILVSCDPGSMARDAFLLAEAGYRLESVEVLDLFPQTHHVETVARFAR
ncbi:MAG: class I SAM-dependent RNA methyltransferase [Ilumatobacter sp.]|uniref:class I SAM-dependent RNA methyltransferase n=1 Tax=Ilumatobacter sp. TaxID=1967498 RepID=UPI00391AA062